MFCLSCCKGANLGIIIELSNYHNRHFLLSNRLLTDDAKNYASWEGKTKGFLLQPIASRYTSAYFFRMFSGLKISRTFSLSTGEPIWVATLRTKASKSPYAKTSAP